MNIIHIMPDGSKRKSVKDMVIENEQFYQVLKNILEKRK